VKAISFPLRTRAIAERLSGHPFVALLDLDGTLAPIASRPTAAAVPIETRRIVETLTSLPGVRVVAVSGRAAVDAARMLDVRDTWTIGNHGLELAPPNAPPEPRADAVPFESALASAREQCVAFASSHGGVIVEDKHWTVSVHYRRADDRATSEIVNGVRRIAERFGLRATRGKSVLEIRPPINVDKGIASVELLRRLGAPTPGSSVFCAGDDRTDEDMFREIRLAYPRAVTVHVASGGASAGQYSGAAELTVADPLALQHMLEAIVDLRRSVPGPA